MDIANKDVTLNILISEDNVLINSTMYNAIDAYVSKKSKASTSETSEYIPDSTTSGFAEVNLSIVAHLPSYFLLRFIFFIFNNKLIKDYVIVI